MKATDSKFERCKRGLMALNADISRMKRDLEKSILIQKKIAKHLRSLKKSLSRKRIWPGRKEF